MLALSGPRTRSQYDLSSTTYSPDGKVFQTEYAQKAVDNGRCVRVELETRDLGCRGPLRSRHAGRERLHDQTECARE